MLTQGHATPFSISGSGTTDQDGSVIFSLDGDSQSRQGVFSLVEDAIPGIGPLSIDLSISDPAAKYSFSNYKKLGSGYQLGIDVNDPNFLYNVTANDITGPVTTVRKGYDFSFVLIYHTVIPGLPPTYDLAITNTPLGESSTPGPDGVVVTNISGFPLPSIPLPASAPMFGAAVFAVGAAGYSMKRKKAVTTA